MFHFKKIVYLFDQLYLAFVLILPNTYSFNKIRANYYRRCGCQIHKDASIAANVRVTGFVALGAGTSIAHNCTLSGFKAGIVIKENVMVAPNCVLVAFDHGYADINLPMSKQPIQEAQIYIEDNVWIGANCTITKGIRIGSGSIVAANSCVNKNVPKNAIVGGVPAKIIRFRDN